MSNAVRVLVTAAQGNVGREVARECLSTGLLTRVAGREERELKRRFPGLETARLDFLDRRTWAPALHACDSLFLLRPPPLGDMETTLCPFVSAAYAAGVQHIVFLSVAGADRMKWVPHHKVEAHLTKCGSAWTVLRPGFFAQNLQDAYLRDIVDDSRIYVPAAQGQVAFVDVRDVAAVAAKVFARPTPFRARALTLTGPEAITFHQVAQALSTAIGRPIRYEEASIPGYAWHLRFRRRMPWRQVAIQTILHVGLRGGDAEKVDPSIEQMLGRPARSMKEYTLDAASTWRR